MADHETTHGDSMVMPRTQRARPWSGKADAHVGCGPTADEHAPLAPHFRGASDAPCGRGAGRVMPRTARPDKRRPTPDKRGAAFWPLWLRLIVAVLIVGILAAPLLLWRREITDLFVERDRVIAALRSAGAWGPAVLIGLHVAQVIAAPIPGQAINFVSGYLFGFWAGLGYSWVGAMLGSAAAMALARLAGRPLVVRLVDPMLLERLDRLAAGRGLGFFFLLFLIPGLPDDIACFAAGLTRLPLSALLVAAAIGRIPGIMAAVWAGASAGQIGWQSWAALAGLSLLAAALVWRYGERFQAWLMTALWGRTD